MRASVAYSLQEHVLRGGSGSAGRALPCPTRRWSVLSGLRVALPGRCCLAGLCGAAGVNTPPRCGNGQTATRRADLRRWCIGAGQGLVCSCIRHGVSRRHAVWCCTPALPCPACPALLAGLALHALLAAPGAPLRHWQDRPACLGRPSLVRAAGRRLAPPPSRRDP